jgi:hypothetical protein
MSQCRISLLLKPVGGTIRIILCLAYNPVMHCIVVCVIKPNQPALFIGQASDAECSYLQLGCDAKQDPAGRNKTEAGATGCEFNSKRIDFQFAQFLS